MSAHHQPQSSFAPPHLQGSVAKAGGHLSPSSLGCLPAPSINHAQMYGDRQAGARLWGQCDRHAPVRVNFVRGQGSNFLLTTGRGFGLGALSADGRGCSPVVAINIKSTRCGISKRVSQRFPSHFEVSVRRRLDSHDANENGLTDAKRSFAPGAKAHD